MPLYRILEQEINHIDNDAEAPNPKAAMQAYWGGGAKRTTSWTDYKFIGICVVDEKGLTSVLSADETAKLYLEVQNEMDAMVAQEHGGTTKGEV